MVPISFDALDVIIHACPAFKQLQSWERTLEKLQVNQTSTGAKPKFAFKRKDKPDKPPSDIPEVEVPTLAKTIDRSPTSHFSFDSKSGCLLTRASFPDASSTPIDSELIITNLENCIVDLMDGNSDTMTPTAVHIRNVTNCVLLLPTIRGTVLLHGLYRCVVAIPGCHQVRYDLLSILCLPSGRPPLGFPGHLPRPPSPV